MKTPIARLLARSPFRALERHAESVCATVEELGRVVRAYVAKEVYPIDEVSRLENEADEVKNEIRSSLPSGLLMPVNRSDLLEFLWQQDEIADFAQSTAKILALLRPEMPEALEEDLLALSGKMLQTSAQYMAMIKELGDVLETAFAKRQIDDVVSLLAEVNRLEHEADLLEGRAIQEIYRAEAMGDFERYHMLRVIFQMGEVVDHMENAGGRLRIMISR
jgi:uncharacterized protein